MKEKYDRLFKKLIKLNTDEDNESGHILQDKIYRKFIKDIVNNRFKNTNEFKIIAKNMYKYIVKEDRGRWYA
jgi:hypothetical protein